MLEVEPFLSLDLFLSGLLSDLLGLPSGLFLPARDFSQLLFPVMGVDGMCHILHFVECLWFPLLAHNVLDVLHQSGIVAVMEDGLVPTGTDSEMGELDVVLDDVLIFLHLQVVDAIFHVGHGVDRTKLSMEGTDEHRPVVDPIRGFVGI